MEVPDVTNRSASFSLVAQSSQQTSTVRPRIVTWTGSLSSSQSQAAHVLIVMIVVSSEHPKSGCAENITATTGALSDSLATYRTSAERRNAVGD
jgi:hypothetical protein